MFIIKYEFVNPLKGKAALTVSLPNNMPVTDPCLRHEAGGILPSASPIDKSAGKTRIKMNHECKGG